MIASLFADAAHAAATNPQLQTHAANSGNGDPLFYFGLNWEVWVIVLIKCLVAFVALLVATALMIWFERKVISDMQSRIGPNRAGPWGLLQTLADGTKLVFKEDLLPDRADSFVFKLAPYLSVIPAVLVFTVVPVGASSPSAATRSSCRWPTRRWASCWCSPCRASPSTA